MKKEIKDEALKKFREKKVDDTKLNKQQVKDLKQIFEEAKQPIKMTNKEFTLGEGELDIRSLSSVNVEQINFRLLCNQLTYLRQLNINMVDIMKLLMVVCKKLGATNIVKELDDLEEDLKKEATKK